MCSIYKLYVEGEEYIYIGSTSQSLIQRRIEHKCAAKNIDTNTASSILFYLGEPIIELLEECPIENRFERERWWIDNTPNALNILHPCQTIQDVRADRKRYYANNTETVKNYMKSRMKCPVCQADIRRGNKSRHIKKYHNSI